MMNIWIVGAGHMGRSALGTLAGRLGDAEFTVLDRDADALERATVIAPGRVRAVRSDVQTETIALADADVVLNLAGPFFDAAPRVAEAALAAGSLYVDIADDIEATRAVLGLDEASAATGGRLITGAGLSPGVSNWLAQDLIDELADVDGIRILWSTHEPDPGGLAPLRHMLHMTVSPALNVVGGTLTETPGFRPETSREYALPNALGPISGYDTAHPEPLTLARAHPGLREISCQGTLQPDWANAAFSTLGRIGFGYSDVRVDIRGASIEPAEFLWALLWERHRSRERPQSSPRTLVHVEAIRAGEVIGGRTIVDDGVMGVGTGLGAAAAVLTALQSDVPAGAHGPEVLDHRRALDHFLELSLEQDAYREGIIRS